MEVLPLRFPHIADQIFEILNNKSLAKCREVHKNWLRFIDDADFPWSRILKKYPTENGQTAMHIAAKTGQLYKCKLLMNDAKEKLPRDHEGSTPFHEAAKIGHMEICELFMNNSDGELPEDNRGYTPFHRAAIQGHLYLCKVFNENAKGKSPISQIGWTPLHAAAFWGKPLVCEWLIRNTEVDKNLPDWLGCTPMHLAGCNNNLKTCKIIIDNEGDNAVKICQFCIQIRNEESRKYVCHYIRENKEIKYPGGPLGSTS